MLQRDEELIEAVQFKSLKDYQAFRKERYSEVLNLKDGERKMVILPGYDFRQTPDSNYGQASPTLIMAERRGNIAIDCSFYLGHNVLGERSLSMDGRDISLMGVGFYYHRRFKKDTPYPEYAHIENDCPLLGHKKCYGSAGSALYGDNLKWIFLNRGSEAIWDEIDNEFKRIEKEGKI